MENTNLVLDGHETGLACKKAVSKCNMSVLIYLIVTSVVALILSFVIGFAGVMFPSLIQFIETTALGYNLYVGLFQVIVMYVIGFPVFYLMTRHLERRDTSVKENLKFFDFIQLVIGIVGIMFIGSLVSGFVTDIINAQLGIEVEDTLSNLVNELDIWTVIIVFVIIGPIFEELIFRKIFIDTIGKYNIRLAIFISAASFSLFHGNITQAIYTFGGGLILSWVYAKTKNFIYPVLLHMSLNFFGSIPSLLVTDSLDRLIGMTDEEIMTSTDPTVLSDLMKVNAVYYMQIGFMALGGLLILSMILGGFFKLKKDENEVKIPFFKKLRILFFNWGTFLFVIYSIITIALDIFTPVIDKMLENMA